MGREKLERVAESVEKLLAEVRERKREIGAVYQRLRDFSEEVGGHLGELGRQIFGMHIVQEMLCEKAGISKDDVKARIEAREAALAEQEKIMAEAAQKAREAAEAARAAAAETTEQPAAPAGDAGGQAPVEGPDQSN